MKRFILVNAINVKTNKPEPFIIATKLITTVELQSDGKVIIDLDETAVAVTETVEEVYNLLEG